jgi:hypothetical protein
MQVLFFPLLALTCVASLFSFLPPPQFLPWFRQRVERMPVRHTMAQYARDIIVALRQLPEVALGPSPSAGTALTRAACAHAAMLGVWDLLRPADVDGVCVDALCARLTLRVPDAAGHDVARLLIAHLVFRLLKPPK